MDFPAEVVQDMHSADAWRVEKIVEDGVIEVTIFSGPDKIIDGLKDAVAGRIARMTVYVGLGRQRVTFDSTGTAILVECRYRRAGHPCWRAVPIGSRHDRIVTDARDKAWLRLSPNSEGT